MKISRPAYFDDFHCLAAQCPDSCCKEWDVQIDDDKAALYRGLSGELGDRLREVLTEEDGETVMTIIDGRCPMWREDGLCRIQAELGEEALCRTCREFPRLTHDYGNFVEMGLELSCPEAARIILSSPLPATVESTVPGGEEPEYDEEAMAVLLRSREQIRKILSEPSLTPDQTLAIALMYGYHAQAELDGAGEMPFDSASALEEAQGFAASGSMDVILAYFKELEILTPAWQDRLNSPSPAPWSDIHLLLARYFTDRYWLQAVSDYDLVSRVKLMIISCLVIKHLGGDLTSTAQLYSKEIENSIDNVESILDGAYSHPAFTDAHLLGLLLL